MQIPSTASSLEDHSSVEIKIKKKKKTKKKKPDNPCPNTPVSHQSSDGAEGGCQPETLLGKKKKKHSVKALMFCLSISEAAREEKKAETMVARKRK